MGQIWYVVTDTITLKDALTAIDGGQLCDLLVIQADRKKNAAGIELQLTQVKKHIQPQVMHKKQMPSKLQVYKNPNHYDNSTRNMKCRNGEIVKVHIRLIKQFNGKTVM